VKLTKEVVQSCDKRKKEMEDGFAGAKVVNDRRLTALETEKQQLLRTMEEEKRSAKAQSETLQQTIEQCDAIKGDMFSQERDARANDGAKTNKRGLRAGAKTKHFGEQRRRPR
jgi:hypothetical protein